MDPSRLRVFVLSVCTLAVAHLVSADPSYRVARISDVSGEVSIRPVVSADWSPAARNYPLTVGDQMWTDRTGRAELAIGSAFVRIDRNTSFSLLNLDNRLAQFRVSQGTVMLRVRDLVDEEVELDTPDGAVVINRPGSYRIDVDDDADARTTVTVRSGQAEVLTDDESYDIDGRQSIVLGDGSPYVLESAPSVDAFEDWTAVRDRRVDTSQSARYVSSRMIGYEDLDDYGTWRDVPGYGQAWYPRARADWVPYRNGRWVWIDPWGWSWIDDEPWGFAPSHYGRWLYSQGGWGWIPGSARERPVYAPALVVFVGGAAWDASFSIGSAPVGWFPLGPREPYVPSYSASSVYVAAVNAPYVDVRERVDFERVRYANRDVAGAYTVVPRDVFQRGRQIQSSVMVAPPDAFKKAGPTQARPGRPSRAETSGDGKRGVPPPAAAFSRSIVVREAPAVDPGVPLKKASPEKASKRNAPMRATRPTQQQAAPAAPTVPQERVREPKAIERERDAPAPKATREERAAPEREVAPPKPSEAEKKEHTEPAAKEAPQERAAPEPKAAHGKGEAQRPADAAKDKGQKKDRERK